MIITIDGPAGSGKSTTARLVAEKMGFTYIDTGATYRTIAYAVRKNGINPESKEEIEKLSGKIKVSLKGTKVFLDNEDITDKIRTEGIGKIASLCATYKGVRENMVKMQRLLARQGGSTSDTRLIGNSVVCEGRDIGTVVFPDAEVKIYMDADAETRAIRRHKELLDKGIETELDTIIQEIKNRDAQDSSRKHSPLKKPENAIIINTTNLSIEEQVEKVIEIIKNEIKV